MGCSTHRTDQSPLSPLKRVEPDYLDTIDYAMSLHIIHRHLSWPEREAAVDHRMWEEAAGSMELQNRIQMRILDTLTEAGH